MLDPIKQVASDLEFIFPLKSAVQVRYAKLPNFARFWKRSCFGAQSSYFRTETFMFYYYLKNIINGHKKPQSNYTLEELLTSKVREFIPFTRVKTSRLYLVIMTCFCVLKEAATCKALD